MLTYEYSQYVTIVEFMRPMDVIQFFCGLHFAAQTWSLVKIPLLHDERKYPATHLLYNADVGAPLRRSRTVQYAQFDDIDVVRLGRKKGTVQVNPHQCFVVETWCSTYLALGIHASACLWRARRSVLGCSW